jgi:hypothetical protein
MKQHAIFFKIGIGEENDCEHAVLDEYSRKMKFPRLE